MIRETIVLQPCAPGVTHSLQVLRFGSGLQGPKAYLQAALHADEVPAMLVARELAALLEGLEARGALRGEIVVVPFANPIGLAQIQLGQQEGRFDLRDGVNFNRGYPELGQQVASELQAQLGGDPAANTQRIRSALRAAVHRMTACGTTQDLKKRLLQLAIDADVVLDLHCDTDAVMHVYGMTPQEPLLTQLGADLGAQAALLATEAGDSPFDEACARPWLVLRELFPQHAIDLACFGATVELRGERDTAHALASQDAQALCRFLTRRGVIAEEVPIAPAVPQCDATPLAASEPITAPHAGVVVFHRQPGDRVQAGDVIAEIVEPASGMVSAVRCESDGLLYARCALRWATPGKRLAKIAGTRLARTGKLLSP
ncbi:succinylglutamate desuccinylase/aspartoacylase family protein [Curvibacter sp. APW13]|uniref:succinylglutamate desuccinylase/aspartoacylase family protein n=1 Tax=Curvibacter sp. APW13 TaxID=3077236 RepID=UPI0028DF4618|nr:succinylglutamate desuccinylase/aspartoacylase family protein [Curvibacter sp. APW13]MDT8990020.1 succinylglutamate desuccinylase/aspartoacylase family protein [Curvibacter sp. APW13]